MDDNLKLVLEYFDEIRQGDFCIQSEKIVNSTIHTMGLYYALLKKGIITRDEWDEGISEMKEIYSKELNEIKEKVRIHKEKVMEIEKNITKENKKTRKYEKAIKDLFGIDF